MSYQNRSVIRLVESESRSTHSEIESGNPALPSLGVSIITFMGHLFFRFRVDCRDETADSDFFLGVLGESSDSSAQLTISGGLSRSGQKGLS